MKSGFKLGDYVETKTLEDLKSGHTLLKLFPPRAPALNIDPDNVLPKIFEARTQGLYEPEQMKMMRAYPQNVLNKVLEHDEKGVVEKFIERFEMSGTALAIVIVVFFVVGAVIFALVLVFFVRPFRAVKYFHDKFDDYDKTRKGEEYEKWRSNKGITTSSSQETTSYTDDTTYSTQEEVVEEPQQEEIVQQGGDYQVEYTDYQPLEGGGSNEVLF
jgi:hypothetical protein